MNCEKIAEYIRSGAKTSENIGVELEHFVICENGKSADYYGENGVGAVLDGLACFFDKKFYSEGQLIALSNGRYHLTLEPAAQLEISIEPLEFIDEIKAVYDEFISLIEPELKKRGLSLSTLGYRPSGKVEDMELIPKKRYEFMDRYFRGTGKHGINMMRGTASAQVSIDYINDDDCIKKFRLANALSPLFAMITDNSPVYEDKIYTGRMIRTTIWSDVDNARCGIVPGSISSDFSIKKYADYILNVPAIFVEANGNAIYTGDKKIRDLYTDMTIEDVEHVLSMVFPDVRLKTYIEIRPADSMPIEYTLSYAAFVKGIFRCMDEVCAYINIDDITDRDAENVKMKLMEKGFDANVYDGKSAYDILTYLLEAAERSLEERDRKYLVKMREIIISKTTLKEQLLHQGI